MAQSIEVDEITFVAPDGSKATMKLRNDGMLQFGTGGGARRMKPDSSTTTSTSTQSTTDEENTEE